jgi:hypothetical protein
LRHKCLKIFWPGSSETIHQQHLVGLERNKPSPLKQFFRMDINFGEASVRKNTGKWRLLSSSALLSSQHSTLLSWLCVGMFAPDGKSRSCWSLLFCHNQG